ncbi:MAG: CoA-binding protein [Desulfobacterales bacterium]
MNTRSYPELHRLFYPQSIAVVGVSPSVNTIPMDQGRNYIKGSINQNFMGKIYPVHPKAQDTLGFKTYASVKDIPGSVDLVIFTVPASAVLQVMEDCVEKKVKFVHLFTAGFSESEREEYAAIEQKLVQLARSSGIRVVGPNCMGMYCPEGGLAFQPFFPYAPGSTAFFSQSGQMAGNFILKASAKGLGFSKVVSFGNSSDLSASEFLEYLCHDDKTSVIGAYLEGLKDGRNFFNLAANVTVKKPLVIYKGGRTDGGSRAAKSHTAAIAGSMNVWESFCRQTGIISVKSLDELILTLSALQRLQKPAGRNAAIIGGAGGGSVTMTDIAEAEGLLVPQLSQGTISELEKMISPQGTSVKNPLDVGMRAFFEHDVFLKIVELVRDDPHIDALIFLQQLGLFHRFGGRKAVNMIIDMTLEAREILKMPLMLVLEKEDAFGGEAFVKTAQERYNDENMATFPSVEMAARVTKNLADYQQYLTNRADRRS